jgi:hypothetical protein
LNKFSRYQLNIFNYMAKIYFSKNEKTLKMKPKKETIKFLLNYSKSVCFNKTKSLEFMSFLN